MCWNGDKYYEKYIFLKLGSSDDHDLGCPNIFALLEKRFGLKTQSQIVSLAHYQAKYTMLSSEFTEMFHS